MQNKQRLLEKRPTGQGNSAKQRENPKGKTDGARLALTSTALLVFLKVGVNKEVLPTACHSTSVANVSAHTHTHASQTKGETRDGVIVAGNC